MKIYFSHAINGTPEHYMEQKLAFKKRIEMMGFDILHFAGKSKSYTSQEIYEHDINMVLESDLILLFTDCPSFGVGQELQQAIVSKKNVLVLAENNENVSRMIPGPIDKFDFISLFRYSADQEGEDILDYMKKLI